MESPMCEQYCIAVGKVPVNLPKEVLFECVKERSNSSVNKWTGVNGAENDSSFERLLLKLDSNTGVTTLHEDVKHAELEHDGEYYTLIFEKCIPCEIPLEWEVDDIEIDNDPDPPDTPNRAENLETHPTGQANVPHYLNMSPGFPPHMQFPFPFPMPQPNQQPADCQNPKQQFPPSMVDPRMLQYMPEFKGLPLFQPICGLITEDVNESPPSYTSSGQQMYGAANQMPHDSETYVKQREGGRKDFSPNQAVADQEEHLKKIQEKGKREELSNCSDSYDNASGRNKAEKMIEEQGEEDDRKTTKLVLKDLPDEADSELIQLFFEKRKFGRFDVLNVEMDEEQFMALVEFSDPEAVVKVLQQTPIEMYNTEIRVKPYFEVEEEEEPLCTIVVCGLLDLAEETIELYFENKRKASGDEIEYLNLIEEGKAFITYKSEEVARRVVDKGNHVLNRQPLEVTLWQPPPKQTWNIQTPEPEPELGSADTIEVRGIGDSLDKQIIKMYFENTKRSGGDEIKDMKVEENVAFITYFSEEVAQKVIDKGKHVLKKQELQVMIWRETMTYTTTPDREHSPEPVSTVVVYGVDRSLDEETLEMYFENNKRSGGGDIEHITVNYDDGVAYITYHEVMVAHRVVNKGEHTLNKRELTVQIYIKPTKAQKPKPVKKSKTSKFQKSTHSNKTNEGKEEPAPTSVVKVKGIKKVTSLESMRYYFENTRRSGGGDIQDLLHHEEDDDIVFITFSEPEVAKKVASREHSVEDKTLQVSLHVPPKPRPFYEDKVLITGLKCTTSKDCLFNFLEIKSGSVPIELQRGEKEGVVLITFENEADYFKLTTVCGKTPLEGATLQVSKVQVTNCIIVVNIPEKTSKDTVWFYFENTRTSNGGPIDKVVMKEEDCSCLVYFMDYKVVDKVIAQKHVISDNDVIVKMFLECIGCPQRDISEMPFKLPDAVIISDLHQKIIKFMRNADVHKTAMADQMEAVNASVSWPKKSTKSNDVVIECTLTKQTKDAGILVKSWKQVAKKNFDDFMKNIVIELVMVSQEYWNTFMEKIKSVQITNPDGVAIVADRDQCSVAVVGMKQIVGGVARDIANMVKQLEEDTEKEREKTKELIKSLKSIETKMLFAEKYPHTMEKKYEGLRVKINQNKNEIVFEGLTGIIKAAKCDMFEMKEKYATVTVDLKGSKSCFSLYDSKMAKDYIVKKLKTNQVTAVWEVRDQKLIVCSTCENTIEKSMELVKGSIVEQSISLTKENVDVVHSDSWQAVLEEQNQKYPGKTAAEVQGNVAYVCGTDDIVKDVLGAVKKFLRTNTIVEDHVDFGKHINRLIEKDHKDEIATISKRYASLNTQVVPKASNTGFTLRGTSDGIEHAKKDLQDLNSKVQKRDHTLQSPGIRDHMAKKGQDHKQTIEQRYPVAFGASEDEDEDGLYDEIPAKMDEGPRIHAVCSAYDDRKIYTAEGDMTELSVDVLVHAADSKLSLTGGLGKAMLAKGGSAIQEACKDYIRDEGELGEGEAFVSSAGKLRAKYIVHIIGPVWNDGTHNEESLLAESVLISMRQASVKNVKSIAIPAISCGVYSFPLKRHTRVIVESVKNFFREMQETTIMEVYLCDVKSKTVEGFMDALGSAFGAHNLKKLLPTQRPSTRPIPKPRPKGAYSYMSDAQPGPDKSAFNTSLGATPKETRKTKKSKAIENLEKIINNEIKKQTFKDDLLKHLQESQKKQIKDLGDEHSVNITFKSRTELEVVGMVQNVMEASNKIHSMIRQLDRMEQQKSEAKRVLRMVQWFFIDITEVKQELMKYDPTVNMVIEHAFTRQEPKVAFSDSDGNKYIIDFGKMKEYHEDQPTDFVNVIRRDLMKEGSFEIPQSWTEMGSENLKVVTLQNTDQEFQEIVKQFTTSVNSPNFVVSRVDRIQNKTLWMQYHAKKQLLDSTNKGLKNESMLWHGTTSDSVGCINANGFNKSYCGKNATAFGDGVYFDVNAAYTCIDTYSIPDSSAVKRMYLCHVLTGDFTNGKAGMRFPPAKSGQAASSLYDSVVNNMSSPTMYIIFNDTQAYPQYLIFFKKKR